MIGECRQLLQEMRLSEQEVRVNCAVSPLLGQDLGPLHMGVDGDLYGYGPYTCGFSKGHSLQARFSFPREKRGPKNRFVPKNTCLFFLRKKS